MHLDAATGMPWLEVANPYLDTSVTAHELGHGLHYHQKTWTPPAAETTTRRDTSSPTSPTTRTNFVGLGCDVLRQLMVRCSPKFNKTSLHTLQHASTGASSASVVGKSQACMAYLDIGHRQA
ncbi:uncharacterized protein ColSpa_01221 [Colletotrichum spaethianum]|uniref:Uncharacterized protein n=1 Tax=Colletotrichum spaethianum TaxID=700344 RepID=A0AA37L6G4_9PEZI|nr:uncharacterized protein ColSpa_01221 [Colletotrichum spaethianum]GKT41040.1 hypothetical protein ColSpa_01221 [Colletotrichum spaethianum]